MDLAMDKLDLELEELSEAILANQEQPKSKMVTKTPKLNVKLKHFVNLNWEYGAEMNWYIYGNDYNGEGRGDYIYQCVISNVKLFFVKRDYGCYHKTQYELTIKEYLEDEFAEFVKNCKADYDKKRADYGDGVSESPWWPMYVAEIEGFGYKYRLDGDKNSCWGKLYSELEKKRKRQESEDQQMREWEHAVNDNIALDNLVNVIRGTADTIEI